MQVLELNYVALHVRDLAAAYEFYGNILRLEPLQCPAFTLKLFNKSWILRILKIGVPVAMQYTFEVSAFGIAAILMGTIGVVQQAVRTPGSNQYGGYDLYDGQWNFRSCYY